jgi:glucose-6-phosphate-specific signal transduction histidine kinase
MASIPIHNETDYTLTNDMTQQIIRDAHDHFGEEVRSIRVQSGIARHAFNARTREVRYAFSPQDFGMGYTMPTVQETPRLRRRSPRSADERVAAILPVPLEDVEVEEEDLESLETSLESLDEGQDDDEEADVFTLDNPLDNPVEDADEDEEDNRLDDEDEED